VHLLIDGYGSPSRTLWDRAHLLGFLDKYPGHLGMAKISEPTVLTHEAAQPEDSGLTGFVIIAESHISVHTFPMRNYVNIDIFSCRAFDSERVLQDIKKFFELHQVNSWVIDRGLEHYNPQNATAPSVRASTPEKGSC